MIKEHAIERMRELVANKTPFVHQGDNPISGIDCVNALKYAFQYEGEIPAYPENPINGELELNLQRIFGPPILSRSPHDPVFTNDQLRALDIVSMQYRGPARHVALVVDHIAIKGALSVIHTDASLNKVTEHILDFKWQRRILKVWRP